jgi:hypothetical protein
VDVTLLVLLIAAATWLVGQVTEHRKGWFEALFVRLAARLPFADSASSAKLMR